MKPLVTLLLFILSNLTYGGLRAGNWKQGPDDSGASDSRIVEGDSLEDIQSHGKQDWNTTRQSSSKKAKEKVVIAPTINNDANKHEQHLQQHLQSQQVYASMPNHVIAKKQSDGSASNAFPTHALKRSRIDEKAIGNLKMLNDNIAKNPLDDKHSNTPPMHALKRSSVAEGAIDNQSSKNDSNFFLRHATIQSGVQWVKGEMASTCDQTCNPLGLACSSDEQTQINTYDKLLEAFEEVGYDCKGAVGGGKSYAGSPFSTGSNWQDCSYFDGSNNAKSSCTANGHPQASPLCACVPKSEFSKGVLKLVHPKGKYYIVPTTDARTQKEYSYSQKDDDFTQVHLEGNLVLEYEMQPIEIVPKMKFTFVATKQKVFDKLGVCLNAKCFWLAGEKVINEELDFIDERYGGRLAHSSQTYNIDINEEFNGQSSINTLRIFAQGSMDNIPRVRSDVSVEGTQLDFMSGVDSELLVGHVLDYDLTFQTTDGLDDDEQYYACGIARKHAEVKLIFCSYHGMKQEPENNAKEECGENKFVAGIRSITVLGTVAKIQIACVDKDWNKSPTKMPALDLNLIIDNIGQFLKQGGACTSLGTSEIKDINVGEDYGPSYDQQNFCLRLCLKDSESSNYDLHGAQATWGNGERGCYCYKTRVLKGSHTATNYNSCFVSEEHNRIDNEDSEMNLAQSYGIATQSTTYSSNYQASHAIDGSLTTFSTTSSNDPQPQEWWKVDLGFNAKISEIRVYCRESDYSYITDSIFGYVMHVTDDNDNEVHREEIKNNGYHWNNRPLQFYYSFKFNTIGRYVEMKVNNRILSMGEVQVYGKFESVSGGDPVTREETNGDWKGYKNGFLSGLQKNNNNLMAKFNWSPCSNSCNDDNPSAIFLGMQLYKQVETDTRKVAVFLPGTFPHNRCDAVKATYRIQINDVDVDTKRGEEGIVFKNTLEPLNFEKLLPGKRYDFHIKGIDNDGNEVDDSTAHVRVSAVVPCSCNATSEKTGMPADLVVNQDMGFVYVTFSDQSLCEEAFSMQRIGFDNVSHVIASNFLIFADDPCGVMINPGREYADDLLRSNLNVGESYAYVVSAIATTYMARLSSEDDLYPSFRKASDSAEESFKIQWEASSDVKVILREDAGSLPVENATITWSLFNTKQETVKSGEARTTEDGFVPIKFKIDGDDFNEAQHVNKNSNLYMLEVSFEKTTVIADGETVDHKFLCDDETIACSKVSIYLKHLDFGKELIITDDTSIQISGNVFIDRTPHNGEISNQNAHQNCPLPTASVCLKQRQGDVFMTTEICDDTTTEGRYSIPATIGSTVSVNVNYRNHTFEHVWSKYNDKDGFTVSADETYNGFHFKDIESNNIIIDAAGGLCNKTIGTVTSTYKIIGCTSFSGTLTQSTFRQAHLLPAHLVSVQIDKVTNIIDGEDNNEMNAYFRDIIFTKDLTEVDDEESPETSTTAEGEESSDSLYSDASSYVPNFEISGAGTCNVEGKKEILSYKFSAASAKSCGEFCLSEQNANVLLYLDFFGLEYFESSSNMNNCYCYGEKNNDERSRRMDEKQHITPTGDNLIGQRLAVAGTNAPTNVPISMNETVTSINSPTIMNATMTSTNVPMQPTENSTCYVYAPKSEDKLQEEKVKQSQEENENQEKLNELTIRFQYDGEPKLVVSLPTDEIKNSTCANDENCPSDECSKHIITTGEKFKPKVELINVIYDDVTCDIFEEGLMVSIINNVGDSDPSYLNGLKESGISPEALELLEKCTASGCLVPIVHDVDESTQLKSRAHINEEFIAGRPNINEDQNFMKNFLLGFKSINHRMTFVVTGDFNYEGSGSISFPTHYPLLVIRDPPGGNSVVSYESVLTTFHIQIENLEVYQGFETSADVLVGAELSVDACVTPFGFGACTMIAGTDIKIGSHFNAGINFLTNFDDKSKSHQFTSTWSYTTSDDPELAGKLSDVFLVPNINVKIMRVTRIEWNPDNCMAQDNEIYTYNLDSPTNKPAFLFFSFPQVSDIEIPTLEKLVENAKEDLDNESDSNEEKEVAQKKFDFVTAALERWRKFINDYEDENTKSDKIKVNDWFKLPNQNNETIPYEEKELSEEHWSGLVPKEFDDNKKELEDTAYDKKLTNFDEINTITFSGGGSGLEMTLTSTAIQEQLKKNGDTVNWNGAAGLHSEASFNAAGSGFNVGGTADYLNEGSHQRYQGKTTEKESSITFTLGDPDTFDWFAVDIYLDPKYGTFIFDTTSGVSSCPWEGSPTRRIENPQMRIEELPPQHTPENLPIVFKVSMHNQQLNEIKTSDPVALEVAIDPTTNTGDLHVSMDGGSLSSPIQVKFDGPQTIVSTIAIERGPEAHVYDPVTLILRSQCDGLNSPMTIELYNRQDNDTNEKHIEYIKPCPGIRWTGDLQYDQKFMINKSSEAELPITIFNMNSNFKTLHDMKGHLEHVYLLYREKGENDWSPALKGVENIDFARETSEERSGYVTESWSAKNLSDGTYQLKVESTCNAVDVSSEYNSFSTEIIEGIIDVMPPSIYGRTLFEKSLQSVDLDDEIAIQFSEEILCSKPHKFGIKIKSANSTFDLGDLDVKCLYETIRFHIPRDMSKHLLGNNAVLEVEGVKDLVWNEMEKETFDFSFSSTVRRLFEKINDSKIKGFGRDGVDHDNNGVIDDCGEEKKTPSISIHSVPVYHKPNFPNIPFLRGEVFSTVDEASSFLEDNLFVTNDSSSDVEVDVSTPEASCDETMFHVKATDLRCGHSVTKSYLLRVDNDLPKVSVGFQSMPSALFYDSKKNILVVEESGKNFMNVKFWYKVEDNCSQKVKVDVTVISNENSYDKPMVMIRKMKDVEQESQLQVYVEPSSCKTKKENEDNLCEWDPQEPIRFYKIHVKATDYGGNVANSTATVVVVPSMEEDGDVPSKQLKQEGLYDEKYVKRIIANESRRYVLETVAVEWDII